MNHYLAEGQFVPRLTYIITAETLEKAEQLFAEFLDGLHGKKTKLRQKIRSVDHKRSSYTITELPKEPGVQGLALWMM